MGADQTRGNWKKKMSMNRYIRHGPSLQASLHPENDESDHLRQNERGEELSPDWLSADRRPIRSHIGACSKRILDVSISTTAAKVWPIEIAFRFLRGLFPADPWLAVVEPLNDLGIILKHSLQVKRARKYFPRCPPGHIDGNLFRINENGAFLRVNGTRFQTDGVSRMCVYIFFFFCSFQSAHPGWPTDRHTLTLDTEFFFFFFKSLQKERHKRDWSIPNRQSRAISDVNAPPVDIPTASKTRTTTTTTTTATTATLKRKGSGLSVDRKMRRCQYSQNKPRNGLGTWISLIAEDQENSVKTQ